MKKRNIEISHTSYFIINELGLKYLQEVQET